MGVHYRWVDDSQVIMYVYIESPWTWKDYNDTMTELLSIIGREDHPCATIFDVSKMGSPPGGGNIVQILLRIETITPPNLFVSVIVGVPYAVGVFLGIVMHLRPRAKQILLFAQTIEEAHKKVGERVREHRS